MGVVNFSGINTRLGCFTDQEYHLWRAPLETVQYDDEVQKLLVLLK
jgi:hypothetical protein